MSIRSFFKPVSKEEAYAAQHADLARAQIADAAAKTERKRKLDEAMRQANMFIDAAKDVQVAPAPKKKRGDYNKLPVSLREKLAVQYVLLGSHFDALVRYCRQHHTLTEEQLANLKKQSVASWKKDLNIELRFRQSDATVLKIMRVSMDIEFKTIILRLVERGGAVRLRDARSLRGAQLLLNPLVLMSVVALRKNGSEKKKDAAAILAHQRTGAKDAASLAAAVRIDKEARQRVREDAASKALMSESAIKLGELNLAVRKPTTSKSANDHCPVRALNMLLLVAQACGELGISDAQHTAQFLINADETGVILGGVPTQTFAQVGADQVRLRGFANKAQITVLEALDAAGGMLTRQMILPGKTDKVHPTKVFSSVMYDHSVSHWSTPETMMRWAKHILVPHIAAQRNSSPKHAHQAAVLLLDVWAAHFDVDFLRYLATNKIRVIPIQPGMTGLLQPCDHHCGPNRNTKPHIYRMLDAEHMRHIITTLATGAGDSAISVQLAESLKQLEKGAPPLDVCLGLGDDDPTILCSN